MLLRVGGYEVDNIRMSYAYMKTKKINRVRTVEAELNIITTKTNTLDISYAADISSGQLQNIPYAFKLQYKISHC